MASYLAAAKNQDGVVLRETPLRKDKQYALEDGRALFSDPTVETVEIDRWAMPRVSSEGATDSWESESVIAYDRVTLEVLTRADATPRTS